MAQFSLSTSMVQRSKGSSAVAHAAYISGGRLVDARTGQEADYTRRSGVECAAPAIVVPDAEPQIERGQLWDMAESAEVRKDGTPARKIRLSLPHELGQSERLAMSQEYAKWLANRFHVAVDFAVHAPDAEGDDRNFHTHFELTTRQYRKGELGEKSHLEWNGSKLKEKSLPSGKAMMYELRERWEAVENDFLTRHAPEVEKVSCRRLSAQREAKTQEAQTLQKQGREDEAEKARLKAVELDRDPQRHVGWEATAMERRLVAQKERLTAEGKSIEHLPAFATERGQQRHQAQQMTLRIVAECRKFWEMGKAAIRDLVQKPATPKRNPVEAELIEFLKSHKSTDAAKQYLQRLPHLAKMEPNATAWDEYCAIESYGLRNLLQRDGPGTIWKKAAQEHKELSAAKKAAETELEKALAANRGIFGGQKKDTPEIVKLKQQIGELTKEIVEKAGLTQSYAERWKTNEPAYQKLAESINAERIQARKFAPFLESGKVYVHQIEKQKQQEQEKQRALEPQKQRTNTHQRSGPELGD